MIIGVSEGDRIRFEVVLMSDGFIVRAHDLDTDEVMTDRDRMFRTAQAAFAFAELSALEDAEDRTEMRAADALEAQIQSDRAARHFSAIRAQFSDSGVSAGLMAAWARQADLMREPRLN
jgi:hypothetical protein